MTFLAPGFLALFALIPLIVLLHLLTRRRRTVSVSSVLLLRRIRSTTSTAPRLQSVLRDPRLWLQILALAAVTLFLATPRPAGIFAPRSGDLVLVVDVSAGMAAPLGDGTRMDEARRRALATAEELRPQRVAVVAAGRRPSLALAFTPATGDRLAEALGALEARSEVGDLSAALDAALALAPPGSEGAVIRAFTDESLPQTHAGFGDMLSVSTLPADAPNVGITAFRFRELPRRPGNYQVIVEVLSSGAPWTGDVVVFLDELESLRRAVTVPAGETRRVSAVLEGALPRRARASVDVESDLDALTVDNEAYVVLSATEGLEVGLLGRDPYLEAALAAIPGVAVRLVEGPADAAGVDVLMSIGLPVPAGIDAGILAFASPVDGVVSSLSQEATDLGDTVFTADHHLLTGLDSSSWFVERALRLRPLGPVRVLAESGNVPLLIASEPAAGRRVVALPFLPGDSSLVSGPDFPILVTNALAWLSGFGLSDPDRTVSPGHPVGLAAAAGSDLLIRRPDGTSRRLTVTGPAAVFDDTGLTGFYTVEGPIRAGSFAVSLLSRSESDVSVSAVETGGGETVPRDASSAAGTLTPGAGLPEDGPPQSGALRLLLLAAGLAMVAERVLARRAPA